MKNKKINILIYKYCIPTILYTFFIILSSLNYGIVPSLLIVNMYIFFYSSINFIEIYKILFILFCMCITSHLVYLFIPNITYISIFIHIIAWILQFIGLIILEKNKKKIINNLIENILMGPIFFLIEYELLKF